MTNEEFDQLPAFNHDSRFALGDLITASVGGSSSNAIVVGIKLEVMRDDGEVVLMDPFAGKQRAEVVRGPV